MRDGAAGDSGSIYNRDSRSTDASGSVCVRGRAAGRGGSI